MKTSSLDFKVDFNKQKFEFKFAVLNEVYCFKIKAETSAVLRPNYVVVVVFIWQDKCVAAAVGRRLASAEAAAI
uniref:Uncharacterized protein n=1 Tax=Syphacia muris TaxID=451379 RepID=A0A0N5ANB5_9BILA